MEGKRGSDVGGVDSNMASRVLPPVAVEMAGWVGGGGSHHPRGDFRLLRSGRCSGFGVDSTVDLDGGIGWWRGLGGTDLCHGGCYDCIFNLMIVVVLVRHQASGIRCRGWAATSMTSPQRFRCQSLKQPQQRRCTDGQYSGPSARLTVEYKKEGQPSGHYFLATSKVEHEVD